ncbi:MAG: TRAP transporter large permease [Pseudomonadota bacterium]
MDIVGWYLFLPFLVFLVLGIPIAFSLALSCTVFVLFSGTRIPAIVLATEMYGAIDSFTLLALPTFVLAGELLNRLNLTERLIRLAQQLVGWIRGGLAHVTVVASMFFAGINGSALADAATIGPIMIPSMVKEGYPRPFAAAVTASAAVLGAIIPPSIPLVIVGGQLQISIGGLFLGGVVPGILIGVSLMVTAYIYARAKGFGAIHRFEGLVPLAKTSADAAPALAIPLLILGGLLFGVFSPTEAGTITVLYTVVIGLMLYRNLNWDKLRASLSATAAVTASALIIVAAAVLFGRIMTFHQVPQGLLRWLTGMTDSQLILLLLIVLLFVIVGMFMDAVANMVILGPLLYPICVEALGMHPIQYGLFLMIGLLLGVLTPPVGLVLFIVSPIARVSLERVSLAVVPFLIVELGVLMLVALVPDLTLALPRVAGLVR